MWRVYHDGTHWHVKSTSICEHPLGIGCPEHGKTCFRQFSNALYEAQRRNMKDWLKENPSFTR